MTHAQRSSKTGRSLRAVADELHGLDLAREAAMQRAFGVLEEHHPAVAQLALLFAGDRQRAARWMCMHQRAFEGRSAYDLLADDDVDTVCDRLSGAKPSRAAARQAGLAY